MILTEFNQPPDCGNLDKQCGNKANKKNGEAKAKLKISIPIIGQNQSPCEATTKTVPINATVQVNEVNVNVKAINNIPAYPSELSL